MEDDGSIKDVAMENQTNCDNNNEKIETRPNNDLEETVPTANASLGLENGECASGADHKVSTSPNREGKRKYKNSDPGSPDDSGQSDSEEHSEHTFIKNFPKLINIRKRNYRRQKRGESPSEQPSTSAESETVVAQQEEQPKFEDFEELPERSRSSSSSSRSSHSNLSHEASSDSDSNELLPLPRPLMRELQIMNDGEQGEDAEEKENRVPDCLLKPKPRHTWFPMQEVLKRQLGYSNRIPEPQMFKDRMRGSLHAVHRLELMCKLEHHTGCVNCLSFNEAGSVLASGSDDLTVCLWDWHQDKLISSLPTGHKSNVFQCKIMPLRGSMHIATCARDGQVRLLDVGSDGALRGSRRIGLHSQPAHKLSLLPGDPHLFLSCGEDGVVLGLDIREAESNKILTCTSDEGRKIGLYSISSHPWKPIEFVVAGKNRFVRIYDRRQTRMPLRMFCPQHLKSGKEYLHVTCALYNYDGTELLATYNDEDIYLWDSTFEGKDEFVHRYAGRKNNATIKGVSFFGPKSEFIVSGSDCGNIFYWEKETEAIVQFMAGDEHGVVNCLEPHPHLPVIATSGLDEDVKVWISSCEQEPAMENLANTVKENIQTSCYSDQDNLDVQMLYLLWRHISRVENRRRGDRGDSSTAVPAARRMSDPDDESHDENDAAENYPSTSFPARCTPS